MPVMSRPRATTIVPWFLSALAIEQMTPHIGFWTGRYGLDLCNIDLILFSENSYFIFLTLIHSDDSMDKKRILP
jgi:hypothetical protein